MGFILDKKQCNKYVHNELRDRLRTNIFTRKRSAQSSDKDETNQGTKLLSYLTSKR